MNRLVLCFGETLGLIFNDPQVPMDMAANVGVSFAGAESNVAIALARLGHSVEFVSAVGADPLGSRILKGLRAIGRVHPPAGNWSGS